MSARDIGLLRSLIREMVNEGQVPSSSIVYYQSPGSTFRRVGYPGKTALKVIGGLYITSWLSDFVAPECITAVSNYGMPLPLASKQFVIYKGIATADQIATLASNVALKTKVTTAVNDWAAAFNEDVNGGTSTGTAVKFHQDMDGIVGTLATIKSNFDASGGVWPSVARELIGIEGSSYEAGAVNIDSPATAFDNLVVFVMNLINAQCESALTKENAVEMIKTKFVNRKDFVDFVKKYTDTMYTDFEALQKEQTDQITADRIKIPQSVTNNIAKVKSNYTTAYVAII